MATAAPKPKRASSAAPRKPKAAPATREPDVPWVTTTNTVALLQSRGWQKIDLLRCRRHPDNTLALTTAVKHAIGVYRIGASIDDPLRPLTAELLYQLTASGGDGKPLIPVNYLWNERLDEADAVCGDYSLDDGEWRRARFDAEGYASTSWDVKCKGAMPGGPKTDKPPKWTEDSFTKLMPSHPFSVERGRHVDVDSECGMRYAVNTLEDRVGSSFVYYAPWGLFYRALLLPCTHRLKRVVVMIAAYDPTTNENVACFVLGTYESDVLGARHDCQYVRLVFGKARGTLAMVLDHTPTVPIMVAGPNHTRERARIALACPEDYSRGDVEAVFFDDHHLLVAHRLPDRSAWEAGLYTLTKGADD